MPTGYRKSDGSKLGFQKGNKVNLGKKLPESHKMNISKAMKGRKIEWKDKIGKGIKKRWSILDKEKRKIRMEKMHEIHRELLKNPNHIKQLSEAQRGEKSHCWKGGISFEPYGLEFNKQLKVSIRQRDNFTCQECNYTEEQLGYIFGPHHIDYNKRNNNPNNLILLCRSCNSKANFKREDWTTHFQNKIEALHVA